MVNDVFDKVASNYDVMNDAMSLGMHRCWKSTFVNMMGSFQPKLSKDENGEEKRENIKVLDVAGGTGDIAF